MKLANFLTFILLLTATACSGFIDRMHQEMDEDDRGRNQAYSNNSSPQFDMYRQQNRQKLGEAPNTLNTPTVQPSIKRMYRPDQPEQRKRYKADDLLDNADSGSLWSGSGNENYLFSSDKVRKVGDIVLIDVQGKLKNEITMELKRMFPPPLPPKKKDGEAASPTPAPAANPQATDQTEAGDETLKEDETVYDRFTSIIIEEIDKKHILIKAQKNVLYLKRKRLVEVQALVARADILPDDTVRSNSFLETTIEVLK